MSRRVSEAPGKGYARPAARKADPGEATILAARHLDREKSLLAIDDVWTKDLTEPLRYNTRDE